MTTPTVTIPLTAVPIKDIERSDSSSSLSSELSLILPGEDDFTYNTAEDTSDSDSEDGSSTECSDSWSDFTLGSEFDSDSTDCSDSDEDDDEFGKVLFYPKADKCDTFLGQPIPSILLFPPGADNQYEGPVNVTVIRRKFLWDKRYLQKGRHGNWVPIFVLPSTRPPVPRIPVPRVFDGPASFSEAHRELFATLPTSLAGPASLIAGVSKQSTLPTSILATASGDKTPSSPAPRISFAANATGPRITFKGSAPESPNPQSTGTGATYPPTAAGYAKPLPFLPAPRPAYVKVYGQIKATSVGVKDKVMGMLEKKEKKEIKDWREMYPELMA